VKRGPVGGLLTVREGFEMVALTLGLPLIATVPVTGNGVFVTATGMEGVGGAAATEFKRGLAPTVPVPSRTAKVPSSTSPIHNDKVFFSGFMVVLSIF